MSTTEDELADRLAQDAQHLLDLIDMLPDHDSTDFWSELAEGEHPDKSDDGYFLKNMQWMAGHLETMLSGRDSLTLHKLGRIAQYVLMFFDREDPRLHKAFTRALAYPDGEPGRFGRRWCEDACATAWRIYVPSRAAERRPPTD